MFVRIRWKTVEHQISAFWFTISSSSDILRSIKALLTLQLELRKTFPAIRETVVSTIHGSNHLAIYLDNYHFIIYYRFEQFVLKLDVERGYNSPEEVSRVIVEYLLLQEYLNLPLSALVGLVSSIIDHHTYQLF